jgi:hypothetical protein
MRDMSFLLTLIELVFQMLTGWASLLGGLGVDGLGDVLGLLESLLGGLG